MISCQAVGRSSRVLTQATRARAHPGSSLRGETLSRLQGACTGLWEVEDGHGGVRRPAG